MSNEQRRHSCGQPDCKVGEAGGVCLEGLVPDECPHHSWLESDDAAEAEDAQGHDEGDLPEHTEPAVRDLHRGEPLTLSDAGVISVSGPSRLVVLAGDQGAGKTTLIASLYEKFLAGRFCGFCFGGSMTLLGFEERAFDARVDSGRERSDTAHTPLSQGLRVLHLCVARDGLPSERLHLLFGDVSGETYRLARESRSDAADLRFLLRTDHLCLVMDGAKLADPRERMGEVGAAQGTLRSLLEAGMLGPQSRVDVVCSKWDLVRGDDARERFVQSSFDEVSGTFGPKLGEVRSSRVAARPDQVTVDMPHGFGLDGLLARWAAPSPVFRGINLPLPARESNERECTRFARRYGGQGGQT